MATVAGCALIGPFFAAGDYAYQLFAASGASVLYPYDNDTISVLFLGLILTILHVGFLAAAILWVTRWKGWRSYLLRWFCFVGVLVVTVGIFLGIGLVYRNVVSNRDTSRSMYYASDMTVGTYSFGVFAATVCSTLYVRYRIGARCSVGKGQPDAEVKC